MTPNEMKILKYIFIFRIFWATNQIARFRWQRYKFRVISYTLNNLLRSFWSDKSWFRVSSFVLFCIKTSTYRKETDATQKPDILEFNGFWSRNCEFLEVILKNLMGNTKKMIGKSFCCSIHVLKHGDVPKPTGENPKY